MKIKRLLSVKAGDFVVEGKHEREPKKAFQEKERSKKINFRATQNSGIARSYRLYRNHSLQFALKFTIWHNDLQPIPDSL